MTPNILLTYKNFAANIGVSHIGLGISSLNTAKVLKKHGINARAVAVTGSADIVYLLSKDPTITNVVVAAPWISATDFMQNLIGQFPSVEFVVNVHSNVGFLQADTNGVTLIRNYIDLEQGTLNFRISANSRKGTVFVRQAYACPCLFLPNLYYLDYSALSPHTLWNGGVLNIGAFGATRPLKNLMSAAGAAIIVANRLKAQTQFWVSSARTEGGAGVLPAIKALLANLPNITLIENGWNQWPNFRDVVRNMHVLINVSYTESFNVVTADGIAEGVPSVVSEAIDWAPGYWVAHADQADVIAQKAQDLIRNPNAAFDGLTSLEQHNKDGFGAWSQVLGACVPYQSLITDPLLI